MRIKNKKRKTDLINNGVSALDATCDIRHYSSETCIETGVLKDLKIRCTI